MAPSFQSFAAIRKVLAALPRLEEANKAACAARNAVLTKPEGALGRLEEIASFLSVWQKNYPPRAERIAMCVFAGNHGIAAKGVSAYPAKVTAEMVANFQSGGAAINQLCRESGAILSIDALHLDRPTKDFSEQPAMTEEECLEAFNIGVARASDGFDLLATGEMGIANTTSAAAICAALFQEEPALWVGRGTGVDDHHLAIKQAMVKKAVKRQGDLQDGLSVLAGLGGRELAAMAGAIFGARLARTPVILDGFVCSAAASCLWVENPDALSHCLAGHVSAEPGHKRLLQKLGMAPLLSLGMRLGEGSGAAVAFSLVKAALACHNQMASFAEAGISGKSEENKK